MQSKNADKRRIIFSSGHATKADQVPSPFFFWSWSEYQRIIQNTFGYTWGRRAQGSISNSHRNSPLINSLFFFISLTSESSWSGSSTIASAVLPGPIPHAEQFSEGKKHFLTSVLNSLLSSSLTSSRPMLLSSSPSTATCPADQDSAVWAEDLCGELMAQTSSSPVHPLLPSLSAVDTRFCPLALSCLTLTQHVICARTFFLMPKYFLLEPHIGALAKLIEALQDLIPGPGSLLSSHSHLKWSYCTADNSKDWQGMISTITWYSLRFPLMLCLTLDGLNSCTVLLKTFSIKYIQRIILLRDTANSFCQLLHIWTGMQGFKEPRVIMILILPPTLQNYKQSGYLRPAPKVLFLAGYNRHHHIHQACSRFY